MNLSKRNSVGGSFPRKIFFNSRFAGYAQRSADIM
jgi:hypothetical protein